MYEGGDGLSTTLGWEAAAIGLSSLRVTIFDFAPTLQTGMVPAAICTEKPVEIPFMNRSSPLVVVILAAGLGTRMKSSLPKVLHKVAGKPMIRWSLDAVAPLGPDRTVVVVSPGQEGVRKDVSDVAEVAIQDTPLGTGHAVKAAREVIAPLAATGGTVLVLYGDTPLITTDTLRRLVETREAQDGIAAVVLGFEPADAALYGRLVTSPDGGLERIVEARDASEAERAIGLCNGGMMAIDGAVAMDLLDRIGNDNAKQEFYLTDLIGIARSDGRECRVVTCREIETMGVDSRAGLARAEDAMQARLRSAALDGGATLMGAETIFLSHDTKLGRDVLVHPHVVFAPGVTVADEVEIRSFSHLEGAQVDSGAQIGPFARLRPGARIGADAHIGNYVEIKNATVAPGAKINHLSYIGDASVGAKANVGAGTITCNYDGFNKHQTVIGAGAFIGSNTSLVAPVTVGEGAITGAGSTITKDVPADAIAVERSETRTIPSGASRFRTKAAKAKAAKSSKV
jgi:bifunctional UDP-N-acetylglucosamine pyrophosphorylase/glucosamine-1-phosphate N-acetyltransferase